jgi:hypothetical protein
VDVDFREFNVVFALSLGKWKSLFFRGVTLVLFFGVGNELCVVRGARNSDVSEVWVKTSKFGGEYEVFGNVVVIFGWTPPSACITNVVVISVEVRV